MEAEALHPQAIDVLRAIANFKAVTGDMLTHLDALRDMPDSILRLAIRTLRGQSMVDRTTDAEVRFADSEYRITPTGRRTLRRLDDADQSRIALPRRVDMSTTWDGRWLNAPARAGALDAFTLPSLRGQDRVPHAAPFSMAVSAEKRR